MFQHLLQLSSIKDVNFGVVVWQFIQKETTKLNGNL